MRIWLPFCAYKSLYTFQQQTIDPKKRVPPKTAYSKDTLGFLNHLVPTYWTLEEE